MKIRVLTRRDASRFQALRLRGLLEMPQAFSSSHEEESVFPPERVAESLDPSGDRAVLGAFAGETLAGIAGVQRESHRKLAHKALIWGVYVAPEFRGGGIGRSLVQAALRHAFALPGIRQVNLGVQAAGERARSLYESLGFEAFGLERDYMIVDGVAQDELHMVHFGAGYGSDA